MRCGYADRLMSEELDHPLPPEQAARLIGHLARCARCRAVRAALWQTEGLFGAPCWSAPDSDLVVRVLARLPRGRRAVIPPAPAWTRASTIVAAALVVVFLGMGGAVLLAGAAMGYGVGSVVQEIGWSAVAAGGQGLGQLVSALGTAAAGLWRTLRWPWAPIGGAVVTALGVVWGWLWARSDRRRS